MEKVNVARIFSSTETADLTQLTLSDGSFQEKVVLCERDESWLSRPVFPQDATLAHFAFLTYKDNLHQTFFSSDLEKKLLAFNTYKNDLRKNFLSSNKTQDQLSISNYEQHLKERLAGISKEWQLLTTAQNESDEYFGAAFWNSTEQQLVFSHRGTNPKKVEALLADIEGIMRNRHISQIDSAATFVEHVLRELSHKKRFKQIQMSITGHSLGAWLAQVTAFSTEYLTIDYQCHRFRVKGEDDLAFHAHTVGFDSPGCRRMLTKLCEMFHHRYEKPDHYFWTLLDITLYLTRPNMVNTCCKHVGTLHQIDIPLFIKNNWSDVACHISYNLHYHSMGNIVMAMSNNSRVRMIQDWPLVIYPEKLKNDELKPSKYLDYACVKLFKSLPSLIYDSIAKSNHELNEFWDRSNNDNSYSPESDKNKECGIRLHYKVRDIEMSVCSLNTFSKVEQLFLFCWPSETKLKVELKNEIEKQLPNFIHVLDKHNSLFENFLYIETESHQIQCQNFKVDELINFTKQLFRFIDKPRIFVQNLARVTQTSVSICNKFSNSYLLHKIVEDLEFKDTIGLEAFLNLNVLWIKTGFKFEIQKIYSILKLYNANYIFLDLMQLTQLNNYLYFSETIKSLTDYILVLDCQQNDLNDKELNLVKGLLTDSIKLKIIIVDQCNLAESIFKDVSKNIVQFVERDSQFNLSDLTPKSNEWLRNKIQDKIMLQGKKIDVLKLIGQFEALDCDIVVELIKNDEIINIGNELMKLWQSEASYAKRTKFIQVNHLVNAFKDDSIEHENEMFAITSFTEINIDMLFQLLKIEDEIDKQKIIDCTSTFECQNENIEYDNFKKINILKAGKEIDFKKICSYNSEKVVSWLEIINQQFYLHQIYDKNFYIKRQLFHCSRVNINRNALSELFLSERFVLCGTVLKDEAVNSIKRNVFFSVNKNEALIKYNEWCAETPETPVHWLIDTGDELVWQKSHCSIKKLRKYLGTVDSKEMDERALANLNDKVVIIVAEPGMGKSTTLTHLSEFKVDDSWVIRLDLKDHQEQILHLLDDYSDTFSANESIVTFLMNVSHMNCALTEILLKYSLSHSISRSLLILFDGYDEIEKVHQDKLILLISYLKVNTFANVWVTSRKHCTIDLEDQLCVFSTTFKELNLYERVNFLKSFWQVRLRLELSEVEYTLAFGNSELSRFKIFSTALLEKVDKVLVEQMSKFMGISLQMRLLAENFLPDFEAFIKACSGSPVPLLDELSLTQIYQRFINIKFTIYFEEKSRLAVELNQVLTKWVLDDLIKRHQYIAFQLLFLDKIYLLLELEEKDLPINENEEIGLKRIGLIHSNQSTGQLEFIHRTFAEYFVATLLLKWLKKPMHCKTFEAIDRLFRIILLQFEVICSFLNEQIVEADVERVKTGCFSSIMFNVLHQVCINNHANLINFMLSFYRNKIWLLKQYDFDNFFRATFYSHNLEITECFFSLTIVDFTVFYKIFFPPQYEVHSRNSKLKNCTNVLFSITDSYKKTNGRRLMNAIKCRTKFMEEFVKCFYLDDLLELFADDEELCQLMIRLKGENEQLCSVEDKINQLLNSIRDSLGNSIGGCDEIRRLMRLIFNCYHIFNFFNFIDARKPREIKNDFSLLYRELRDFIKTAKIAVRLKNYNFRVEQLEEELAEEKRCNINVHIFLTLTQFDLIEVANQLENEKEICEYLELFIKNADLPELLALLENLSPKKKNFGPKIMLVDGDLVPVNDDNNDDDESPQLFSWFADYRDRLQSDLQKEMIDAKIGIKFILYGFSDTIESDIFSIFPSSFSNLVESFLNGYESQKTKKLLSRFLPILTLVDFIFKNNTVRKLMESLVKNMDNNRIQTRRDVLNCVQHLDADVEQNGIDRTDFYCIEIDVKILKDMFQVLLLNNEEEFYKAVEKLDYLYLKRMLSVFSKDFPGIFFLFIFRICNFNKFTHEYSFQEKNSLILDLVWKTFPDIACCLLTSDFHAGKYTHLGNAIGRNRTKDISLLFKILKPYSKILEKLLLSPLFYNHKNCLFYAIEGSEIKTLEHFLMELNRNTEVMRCVIESSFTNEEDKLNFYQVAEVNNSGALLIFLNSLKNNKNALRDFFLPADKSEKPGFYLAGERCCKEVLDTLLSALKSEPDTLWELLIWAEANTRQTVLHRACERGYVEIADALLNSLREQPEQLRTLFSIKDISQHTALDCAILSERQYFRKNFNKNLIDNSHYKILRDSFGDENCIEQQIESLEKISGNLINVPMVINLILIIAKSFNNVELMLAIFQNELLNAVLESMFITLGSYSYHLFDSAIRRNSLELVEKLVHLEIDINYTDGYGVTPLMRAVQENRVEIVRFLIESGVDVYARDMHGTTAIALANDLRTMMGGLFLQFRT